MTDIFLYQGEVNPSDIVLRNPLTSGVLGTAYTLNAETGTYLVTGSTASLLLDILLNAVSGSYTFSGSAAVVGLDKILIALPDTYIISGISGTFSKDVVLSAQQGSYLVSGSNATTIVDKIFNAEVGSYTITGSSAVIGLEKLLSALAGSYSLSGSDVTFEYVPATGTFFIYLDTGEVVSNRLVQITGNLLYDENKNEMLLKVTDLFVRIT